MVMAVVFVIRQKEMELRRNPIIIGFTSLVSILAWVIYNSALYGSLRRSLQAYINETGRDPVLNRTIEKMSVAGLFSISALSFYLFFYGRIIIPLVVIGIALLFIVFQRITLGKEAKKSFKRLSMYLLIFLAIQMVLLVNPIFAHQPDRIVHLNFVIIALSPLFVLSLYLLFKDKKGIMNKIAVVGVLSLLWTVSMCGSFDSSLTHKANTALTYNEVQGMMWYYGAADQDNNIAAPSVQIGRFNSLLNIQFPQNSIIIPDHFGYIAGESSSVSDSVPDKTYIINMNVAEYLYQDVPGYVLVGRYNQGDYMHFRSDSGVMKLYDSLNIDIHLTQ